MRAYKLSYIRLIQYILYFTISLDKVVGHRQMGNRLLHFVVNAYNDLYYTA